MTPYQVDGEPQYLAVGSNGVWVAVKAEEGGRPARLLHFDGAEWDHSIDVEKGVAALVSGGGSVWVALREGKRVLRLGDGGMEHVAWLPESANQLAYGAHRIWAALVGGDLPIRLAQAAISPGANARVVTR